MPSPSPATAALRRLRRNLGILATGSAINAALGIATLALLARALEPTLLGVLALVQSYVVILNRLGSFDTWQGVVRFGARAKVEGKPRDLMTVTTCAVVLDAASAAVAGVAGVTILLLAGDLLNFSSAYLHAALVYSAALFFQLPSAPIGIMRLFNRFGWITAIAVSESAARLVAAAILFGLGTGVSTYIYAFGAILIVANLLRVAASLYLLRRESGPLQLPTGDELRAAATGFARFSAGSWITGTLNVSRREGTIFVVAVLLGTGGAGYYAVAQRLIQPIKEAAEMLRHALFPDLSKLAASNDHRNISTITRQVLGYTIPVALALLAVFAAAGEIAIRLIAGDGYGSAYWILVALATASALYLCMPLLSSLVILFAGMKAYVMATATATAVWALVFWIPMIKWGVKGAGVGEVVYVIAWIAACVAVLRTTGSKRASR